MPMSSVRRVAVLTLALALCAQAADPLPTPEQVQALADKKDWPALLAAVSRVLPVKGPATAAYDRVDLWMKKGEAQLQSNQFLPASQSFANAASEKSATPEQADLAVAMAELTKKSDAKGYKTPGRQGPPQVFDIRDAAKRPDAFAALFTANFNDLTQRVKRVKVATDPKPLVDLAKSIGQLRALDRVVNKAAAKSDGLEKEMAGHFAESVNTWATSADRDLAVIQARADEVIEQRIKNAAGQITIRSQRRGVQPADQGDLRKVMQQAEKLATTFTAVGEAMTEPGQAALTPARATIQTTHDKAKMLQADSVRINAPRMNSAR